VASIADVYVTVLPETSKVADGIRKAFREVDKDAREAGGRWKKEIEGQLDDVTVKVEADTAKARAEIKSIGDEKVTVKVDVDRSALDRLTTSVGGAGGVGGAGSGGGLLSGIGLQPLAIAAAIPLVSSLSGVLGLLPAAAGGAAGAIGTLMVSLHGFGDAMKDINDPKKFAEDLTQISPAAQQAAQAIQGLMPQINTLMMTVQDAFFNGIGAQIQGLAGTYLPVFQNFMGQMAGTMNRAMTGLSQLLQTPDMISNVQIIVNNLAIAFEQWSKSINPIVSAFTQIGVVGSQFLPQLGQAAAQAATSFSEFITQINQSGKLGDWIQTGIQAFGELQNITQTIIRAFMDMAPAGMPVLSLLSSTLATLEPMVGPLATAFGNWVTAMSPLVNMVAQLVTSLMPLFISAMSNLNQTITGTVGVISTMVGWLGQLSSVMNAVAGSSNFANGFFNGIAQAAQMALNPLQQLYEIYKAIKSLTAGGSLDLQANQKLQDAVTQARNGTPKPIGTTGFSLTPAPSGGALGGGLSTPTGGPVDGWTGKPIFALPPSAPVSTYVAPPLPPSGGSTAAPKVNLPYTGTADPNGVYGMPAGTNSGGYGGSGAQFPPWVYAVGQQFGVKPSTYPGHQETNRNEAGYAPNPSHENRGIDWSGTPQAMQSFADYLKTVPGMEQVIWNGAGIGTGDTVEIAGGRSQPGYFASDLAGHGNHVHTRQSGAIPLPGQDPMASMYNGMGYGDSAGTGLTSSDMSLRNAQQRVNDTQHSQEQAEARLNELRAKGTATDRQLEAAEYAVAKAKREHTDAIDSLSIATDKYNKKSQTGKGGDSGMSSLGTDLMGGIAQFFGFDGSLFADPTQFGLMKFITGAANLKTADSGNGMAPTGGGGGGLLDLATQFMPGMPGGNSPNLMDAVQFSQTGGPGSPGPGNNPGYQNSGIDMRGAQLGVNPGDLTNQLNSVTSSQNRWGPLLRDAPS
jgi:hypothetical protein